MRTNTRGVDLFLAAIALACAIAGFVVPFALTGCARKSARRAVGLARDPERLSDPDRQDAIIEILLNRVDLYMSVEAYACMFFGLVAAASLVAVAHVLKKRDELPENRSD